MVDFEKNYREREGEGKIRQTRQTQEHSQHLLRVRRRLSTGSVAGDSTNCWINSTQVSLHRPPTSPAKTTKQRFSRCSIGCGGLEQPPHDDCQQNNNNTRYARCSTAGRRVLCGFSGPGHLTRCPLVDEIRNQATAAPSCAHSLQARDVQWGLTTKRSSPESNATLRGEPASYTT